MTAYIYLNPVKDPYFEHTKKVINALQEENIACILNINFKSNINIERVIYEEEERAIDNCDIVVTIGGDGTILHAASLLFGTEKPLLGVNLGRVGFLALIEPTELHLIKKLKNKDYSIEKRSLVDIYLNDNKVGTALNEILISQGVLATAIGLELYCDGILVNNYRADGLLVATPTGSTAYSLSAGGPILDTAVEALLATPICAHSLYSPSIVFSGDRVLSIKIPPDERVYEYTVTIDGHTKIAVTKNDTISVKKSDDYVHLISFFESKQFASIDAKLKWR